MNVIGWLYQRKLLTDHSINDGKWVKGYHVVKVEVDEENNIVEEHDELDDIIEELQDLVNQD